MKHRSLIVEGLIENIEEVNTPLRRSFEEVGTVIDVDVEKIDEEDQPT